MKPKGLIILGVIIIITVGIIILYRPKQTSIQTTNILHPQPKTIQMIEDTFKEVKSKYGNDCYLTRLYATLDLNGNLAPNKKWYLYFSCPNEQKNLNYKYTNAPEFWQEESKYTPKDKLVWQNLKPISKITKVVKERCDLSKGNYFHYSLKFDKNSKESYWLVDCTTKDTHDYLVRIDAVTGEIIQR